MAKGGKRNSKHHLKLSSIQKPSEPAWSLWKSFIFRNFITGNTEVDTPLHKQDTPSTTPHTAKHTRQCRILTKLIKNLPEEHKQIIGEITYSDEYIENILHSYNNGNLICRSDGSLVAEKHTRKGTHAYSIQTFDNDTDRIHGSTFTPMSTTISSLTVETNGVIANPILLESLSKINTKNKGSPRIKIITNNKEVIKRCNNPPEIINANQTMVPE